MQSRGCTTILIGNPGAGKSTLFNGILQRPAFLSGISLGKGLTRVCQVEHDEFGNVYIDTPGLADITMREKAAQEISTALRRGGLFKIIFVITTEDGRIRCDDKTTIRLVTQAAPIGSLYSIIVNKEIPEVLELLQNSKVKQDFITMLNAGLPGASKVFINPWDDSLRGKNNMVPILPAELLQFLLSAPTLVIPPENVKDVQANEFEEIKKVLEKELEELKSNAVLLQQKIEEQRVKYEDTLRKNNEHQQQMQQQFQQQTNQMKQHYEHLISQAKSRGRKRGFMGILGDLIDGLF